MPSCCHRKSSLKRPAPTAVHCWSTGVKFKAGVRVIWPAASVRAFLVEMVMQASAFDELPTVRVSPAGISPAGSGK